MINTPNINKIDLRKQIELGLQKDINLSVKLEKNYKPFADAIWQKKQDEMYLNMLHVKNNVSLGQLLANELENDNQTDISLVKQITMSLLLTITDEKIAKYVIDNLSLSNLNYVNQNWPSILSNLKKNNKKMNKEVFTSLLKLNSTKIDNDILSVTKRHTNYEVPKKIPDAKVINTKQELPIIDFGNQSMKVILDRIYKMDGSEMEDLTDDIDAKNEFVRELSKKNKTELVKHIYQRTERTVSNSNLQKPKLLRVAKYLGYLTIKIQSEEGLKSENIDEETESYDNMR